MEQELLTLLQLEFTPCFWWGSCYSILSFMFCGSLFVLFLLAVMLSFDLLILITTLVSSNAS